MRDEYGGSLHNCLRFLREIVGAVAAVVGPERLGVRFTPLFTSTDQDRVHLTLPKTILITRISRQSRCWKLLVRPMSIAEADWDNAPDLPAAFREEVRRGIQRPHHLCGSLHGRARRAPDLKRTLRT